MTVQTVAARADGGAAGLFRIVVRVLSKARSHTTVDCFRSAKASARAPGYDHAELRTRVSNIAPKLVVYPLPVRLPVPTEYGYVISISEVMLTTGITKTAQKCAVGNLAETAATVGPPVEAIS
jgi:hypothetical protein